MSAHGTNTGYVLHYRNGEKPCPDCLAAHKAYQRKYAAARHKAIQQLTAAHLDEYRALIAEGMAS